MIRKGKIGKKGKMRNQGWKERKTENEIKKGRREGGDREENKEW